MEYKGEFVKKKFMTIQLKTRSQWRHQILATMMDDKDFEDFEKLTYFSYHEDDIPSQQILAWSKIVSM